MKDLHKNIVVGRIDFISQHPNATKLKIAIVTDGNETLEVVCGAGNIRKDDFVAWAKPGSVLPDGTEIATKELKGVISNGMLCSEVELGIGNDERGILILNQLTDNSKLITDNLGSQLSELRKPSLVNINKLKVDTDEAKIDEILSRGVHEVFTKEDLKAKLMSGRQLHFKLGTDVTGSFLHLGHAVTHRKIRDIQELGHKITLIIGDFTTLVGDHSDKVDMRKETNMEEIAENEKTWKEQFLKTVHEEGTTFRHNSEWLRPLNFNDVIHLAKQFTVSQMLDRETFLLRYNEKKPIGLDEFMYPLMQGYDSVALNCDVEFGSTDQTFNLLAGRKLMEAFGQVPQSCMVTKLLTGNDGRPMGKSLKNYIPVMDNSRDMYGKVMSIIDEVIFEYFELVTRVPMTEIEEMKKQMQEGTVHPMELKKKLASEIVRFYHDDNAAIDAADYFERTVQNKEVGDDISEIIVKKGKFRILELVKQSGLIQSNGEAKRLISQGAVSIDGVSIKNQDKEVEIQGGEILKAGKRKVARLVIG